MQEPPGEIYFWRYRRNSKNYRGWHFTARKDACEYICERIKSRLNMQMEREVKFPTLKPSESVLAVPGPQWKIRNRTRLSFAVVFSAAPEYLEILELEKEVRISASAEFAQRFMEGVNDVAAGRGDYCIGGEDQSGKENHLWFWWMLK